MNLCFIRCFGRALKLMPEAPGLWCDLGLNYCHQSRLLSCFYPEEDQQPLLEKAIQVHNLTWNQSFVMLSWWCVLTGCFGLALFWQCVKKAIMLDSANHTYWNALGVVSMAKGRAKYTYDVHICISLDYIMVLWWTFLVLIVYSAFIF